MSSPAGNLITEFISDLDNTAVMWQIVVLACCIGITWLVRRAVLHRMPNTDSIARKGALWVMFPLVCLLLVLISETILQSFFPVRLLDIAGALLLAMVLIRMTIYVLRLALGSSRWLKGSERAIATVVWIGFALHLTGFLPGLLEMLENIAFNVGKQRISLLHIITGLLSVIVTILITMSISRALETRIMASENLNINVRVVITKLIRTALIVLGVLIALPLAGIDITMLSVFGGALGVGLGFGLQKIASNYVSGFIILLDRSIHPGDMLTVDGRFGKVTRLTSRYMVLESGDGTEAIIPNETLIASTVINHSYTNRRIRIALPVQIGYQSNLDRAMQILEQAAAMQPRVLKDPAPKAFLKSFGADGIDLELGFWIGDPEEGRQGLTSEINMEIWRQFQQVGIEIPFPQRDVHIIPPSVA